MNMGNLNKLALTAQEALQQTLSIAAEAEVSQAEPIHMLKALLESQENNLSAIIKRIGADASQLLANVNAEMAKAPKVSGGGMMMQGMPSIALMNLLDNAVKIAEKLGDSYATSEHLLIALSEDKGAAGKILNVAGVTRKSIEAAYEELRGETRVTDQHEKAQFEALEQYGQNVLADKGEYLAGYTFDGEVYGIPKTDQEGQQGTGLALRKDWLERLGLAAPTTIDEFYDVMVAFTENDPDGNGQNDTRGLVYCMTGQAQTRYCFPEIFGMSSRYENLVDGKVVPNLLHPNYIQMIEFLQKLYRGNYMETDFATKPWINIAEDLWAGKFGAVAFGPIGTSNNWMSRYLDPNVDWVYVNLAGPDGQTHGFDLPRPDLGDCIAINAQCEHPEEAMQLINYLITEEAQDLLILGIEGKHFVHLEDGSVEYLSPYKEDITLQRNEGGYGYKALLGSMKNCSTIKTLNQITRDAIDFLYANPKTDSVVLLNAPAIEVELGGLLGDIENEALASLIVFEGDLEAELAKYVDKWLKSGGEEWIEQATEIYNSQAK